MKKKEKSQVMNQDKESETKPLQEAGQIIRRATSNGYYSYYIPKNFSNKSKLPVLIFLDPHADGSFPLTRYKNLAEKFGIILIGSEESKNGLTFDQINEICARLQNEAFTVLPGNQSMINLAGFSGGAKAALIAGNTVKGFNSIIYCGAAITSNNLEAKVPILGFAGRKDMNYTEVKNYNFSLNGTPISHSIIEWDGKHEWPDSSSFLHAFYWIALNEMKKNPTLINKETIAEYESFVKHSIFKSDVLAKAILLREAIKILDSLAPLNEYKKSLSNIENAVSYQQAKKKFETALFFEDREKQELAASFDIRDLSWWTDKINKLKSEKTNLSNERILGYISLAAWSYSSKAVEANNVDFAQKALEIYKMADPENSEQPFLKACLFSKNNQADSALYYLNEAVMLGLKDKSKIQNEEKLFNIRARREFSELVEKIN